MKVDRLSSVIDDLAQVLRWSRHAPSRAGYFAALYWHVATSLRDHLQQPGYFEHPELIQHLNEVFFSRYLDAFSHWRRGEPVSESWAVAFGAIDEDGPIVLQHLLMGANAHINLDLAVAVTTAVPASRFEELEPDYQKMNDLLCDLIEPVLEACCRILPALRIATRIGGRAEATLMGMGMRLARHDAWREAQALAALVPAARPAAIADLDRRVAAEGRLIHDPGWLPDMALWLIRRLERGDIREIIADLRASAEAARGAHVTQPAAGAPAPASQTAPPSPAPAAAQGAAWPIVTPPPSARSVPPTSPDAPITRRRVAIIGGGQAGLTAALQLSDPANPAAAQLDITVHQLGWRLGGKGATGRPGPDQPWAAARIQEHGLHNWFGFYDNSFHQMRRVYEELGRPPDAPLATFEEAFEGANEAAFVEQIEGQTLIWAIHNITNDAKPGEGGLALSPWQYIEMALTLARRLLAGSAISDAAVGHPTLAAAHAYVTQAAADTSTDLGAISLRSVEELLASALALVDHANAGWGAALDHPLVTFLDGIRDDLEQAVAGLSLPGWIRDLEDAGGRALCWVLSLAIDALWDVVRDRVGTVAGTEQRRLWIMGNLGYAAITGAIKDGVIDHGFDAINGQDYRAWLSTHLHDDDGLALGSPIVEAAYTGLFAYPAGDAVMPPGSRWPVRENTEAGTTLRGLVRAAFTYKGSFAYRFVAGTADTCYAPAYQVLRQRGVKVELFHRARGLSLKNGLVDAIDIGVQAGTTDYQPFVDVRGLPCWPDQPRWDQLDDGDWFRAQEADFESPAPEIRSKETSLPMRRGVDFDDVIIAVPISALPALAPELIAASPAWAASVDALKTVRTQAFQAWLTKTPQELGFPDIKPPIVTWLYDAMSPLNVWGDYPEIIPQEAWPADATPKGLAYFCSTMPDDEGEDPTDPFPDQARADAVARANAIELLERGIGTVLPGAIQDGTFDWNVLHDPRPTPGTGPDRIDAQWIRANVTPTERYVLSVVGSSAHRLPVHDPLTFPNVYLAGDWTRCTIDAGCMEAATMSGMLASNALSGWPLRTQIVGVDF